MERTESTIDQLILKTAGCEAVWKCGINQTPKKIENKNENKNLFSRETRPRQRAANTKETVKNYTGKTQPSDMTEID